MRKFSLRGYFDRHPAVTLGLVGLAMTYGVARAIQALVHARGSVLAGWALPVAAGLASSLALIAVTAAWFWRARRRHIGSARLGLSLLIGVCVLFWLGAVYTRPVVVPLIGPPATVANAFQLAAVAFMVPLYGGLAALAPLLYVRVARSRTNPSNREHRPGREYRPDREHRPGRKPAMVATHRGDVLTALIGPGNGGWSVTWVRAGETPPPLTAPTLTAAAEQATEAAQRRRSRHPGAGTQLVLAIYPVRDKRGPALEISGVPGGFTATNPDSGATLHGATLEDLVTAAASALGPAATGFTLRWTKRLTAAPAAPYPSRGS